MKPTKHRAPLDAPSRLLWLALIMLSAGCVSVRYPIDEVTNPSRIESDDRTAEHFDRLAALTEKISALGPDVDPGEAAQLAQVALVYPMELAQRYQLTQPAITHNVLVNLRLKPRGLCIHWTEDMLRRLRAMQLKTLDLYWGVAYPPNFLRLEHSSPIVTAKGQPYETGVLLDAWRDSGRLFFAHVREDKRYAWEQLQRDVTLE